MLEPGRDFWVYGYGSLMWEPGFPHQEVAPARLFGYHRSLCVLSIRNRGTEDRPGLAVGLDRGGSCQGLAFRVGAKHMPATRAYLWARELGSGVYEPRWLSVRLSNGERIAALGFVTRADHRCYYRAPSPEDAARLVLQGVGAYGSSYDYLLNVVRHLDEIGIADGPLHEVLAVADAMRRTDHETRGSPGSGR